MRGEAAEIKNQVQTVKNSPEAQQQQATTESKEVAEMQQECSDSVKEVSRPRTEFAYTMRMSETTSAQEVPQRITASRREAPTQRKTR